MACCAALLRAAPRHGGARRSAAATAASPLPPIFPALPPHPTTPPHPPRGIAGHRSRCGSRMRLSRSGRWSASRRRPSTPSRQLRSWRSWRMSAGTTARWRRTGGGPVPCAWHARWLRCWLSVLDVQGGWCAGMLADWWSGPQCSSSASRCCAPTPLVAPSPRPARQAAAHRGAQGGGGAAAVWRAGAHPAERVGGAGERQTLRPVGGARLRGAPGGACGARSITPGSAGAPWAHAQHAPAVGATLLLLPVLHR